VPRGWGWARAGVPSRSQVSRKVELLLPLVARGFLANPTATREALFVFVHHTLRRSEDHRARRINGVSPPPGPSARRGNAPPSRYLDASHPCVPL